MARQMTEPVKSFSWLRRAARTARRRGSWPIFRHRPPRARALSDETIDLAELVWHLDEPLADLSSLGFLALSELAATKVTVALSGQGADELLGGYRKHRAAAITAAWTRLPRPLRATGLAAMRRGPSRLARATRTLSAPDPAARLIAMSGNIGADLRRRLVRGPLAELNGDAALGILRARLGSLDDDPLPAALYLDAQFGLVDDMLHYFDRASMAHSLEVRVPFLDHHVVEFCATIPARHKVRRLNTKHVLKHAARGLIPDRIIDKPKVGFFNSTVEGWFRNQATSAVSDYLLGPSPAYAELLDRSRVEALVRDHVSGRDTSNSYTLLSVLMLEIWLSSYLPRATGAFRRRSNGSRWLCGTPSSHLRERGRESRQFAAAIFAELSCLSSGSS
jgi:asparagine synthase (glutamine-hydrolysing)